MRYTITNGENVHFVELCNLLDKTLDEIVGNKIDRSKFIPFNTLEDIHDVILAYDDDVPIGCVSFKRYDDDTAEVKRVFVRNEYRGKGISKQLMKMLIERAKDKGYKRMVLETGELLVASMGLYKSIGFYIIENYGRYKNISESLCMEKLL